MIITLKFSIEIKFISALKQFLIQKNKIQLIIKN